MIKLFLKRQILKNRALILQEGKQIEEFFQLLMKQRNTGVKWTGDEKARLKSHLKRLSLYVPALIIFVLPFGSFFIPILAEILDRREKSRANSKNAQMENSTMVSKGSPGRPEKSRYRRLTLLFMSGTGNSYRNAKWIESEAATLGLEVNLALVPATQPPLISLEQETLLGLVMPTHGFTAPWPMIKCVLKLPRGKRTHAFAIVGRGGSKIGNTYIPGVEGTACYLMALLLILKGFHVRGVLAVDMPANWVVAYPAPAPTKASEIMGRARTRTLAFFTSILEGKSAFGGWIGLSFGILLIPISIAYLLVGRFFLAKLFFANNDCNGCGLCAGQCSYGGIRMKKGDKPWPYWTYRCESCMRCMAYCPEKAVEAGHSWAAILYFVSSTGAAIYFLNLLVPYTGSFVINRWLSLPLKYAYLLVSMAAAYWLFSLLLRVPFINSLFTYTTFTHVFRRYHEAETKAQDLL